MTLGSDAGLQSERTRLAWTRTTLALLAGALVALRVGLEGPLVVAALAVAAMPLALGAAIIATHYARAERLREAPGAMHGGSLPSLVALATASLALAEASFLLTR